MILSRPSDGLGDESDRDPVSSNGGVGGSLHAQESAENEVLMRTKQQGLLFSVLLFTWFNIAWIRFEMYRDFYLWGFSSSLMLWSKSLLIWYPDEGKLNDFLFRYFSPQFETPATPKSTSWHSSENQPDHPPHRTNSLAWRRVTSHAWYFALPHTRRVIPRDSHTCDSKKCPFKWSPLDWRPILIISTDLFVSCFDINSHWTSRHLTNSKYSSN